MIWPNFCKPRSQKKCFIIDHKKTKTSINLLPYFLTITKDKSSSILVIMLWKHKRAICLIDKIRRKSIHFNQETAKAKQQTQFPFYERNKNKETLLLHSWSMQCNVKILLENRKNLQVSEEIYFYFCFYWTYFGPLKRLLL
jgi:hypothetical protein